MSKIKIALVQMHVEKDKYKNLETANTFIKKVAQEGCDLAILPEMFTTPYKTDNFPIYAEFEGEDSFISISNMAKENSIYLVGGSIPEKDEKNLVYNTSYVFDRNGNNIGKHRKVHLFDIDVEGGQSFKESDTLTPGNNITVFDTEFGKIGLCICFDFRFPELARLMVQKGAKTIIVPAAFNMTTGPAHWDLMFRSRAIDNQVYAIGCAPSRDINGPYVSYGNSIVTTPWGDILYKMDEKEGYKILELDLEYVDKIRKELPLISARRLDLYELKENPALLTAFDGTKEISDTNPDYADVKIAFKVTEPNGSSKILVNSAQITDDTDKNGKDVDDIDSTPDKWVDGEDDQDKEYIKLTEFDLALRKWVTQAIVIENGKETVTQTGHKAEDNPEQVVKVELNRKKLNSVTVKFRYSIRVTNEGDIAGYAKQIKDYIPEGLKFDAKDNPDWKDEGNNIITTRKLENTLLQPGQSAEVEVLLTWKNDKNNLGLKVNTAEISEDYNEKHVHDKDSTPNNKVPGEDDIDDAPVLLSISTGAAKLYIALSCTVLITLAGGIVLIKKFVL